jgi:D-glycero-D-manno-heptose 1,7-bisphosphate phosphatase
MISSADPALRAQAPTAPLKPAVFINQNGALTDYLAHNTDPTLMQFKAGVFDALAGLAVANMSLVVVANESGIGLGYFTRSQYRSFQTALQTQMHDQAGITLTDYLLCPHTTGEGGRPSCLCRKPGPGLLVRAARTHRIDLAASWMVSDSLDDIEAGRRAGCRTVLLNAAGIGDWHRSAMRTPHARCTDWGHVLRLVLADRSALPQMAKRAATAASAAH